LIRKNTRSKGITLKCAARTQIDLKSINLNTEINDDDDNEKSDQNFKSLKQLTSDYNASIIERLCTEQR